MDVTSNSPPCQALSLSVGENNSIRAPTTSSANGFGSRPVILPILATTVNTQVVYIKALIRRQVTNRNSRPTHFNNMHVTYELRIHNKKTFADVM